MDTYKATLLTSVYFAREGANIDGIVVSPTVHPDNDPADNWDDIGCVEGFQQISKTNADDVDICYDKQGNIIEVTREISVMTGAEFKSVEMNPLADELVDGLDGPVILGQPMLADQKAVREIKGWMKFDQVSQETNQVYKTRNIYGVLKLKNLAAIQNGKSTKPEWKFERRPGGPSVVRYGPAA